MGLVIVETRNIREGYLGMFTTAAGRPWLWTAVLGIVVFGALTAYVEYANGPTGLDSRILLAAVSARTAMVTSLAVIVTDLGSFPVVVVVALTTAVVLWSRTRRLLLPVTLLITVIETAAIVYLVKEIVGRRRPPVTFLIGAPSTDGSFPSGHTTNGTVVYVLAALFLGWTIGRRWCRHLLLASAVVVGIGIGLTRIYLGYHWASDVLGGWLLATALCTAGGFTVCRVVGDRTEAGARPGERVS